MKVVKKSPITTHILDTSIGLPAQNIPVTLEYFDKKWTKISSGKSNADGRISDLLGEKKLKKGKYKIIFEVQNYFTKRKIEAFYPVVEIIFVIKNEKTHYHVPLLLNPYGYSTYRGS